MMIQPLELVDKLTCQESSQLYYRIPKRVRFFWGKILIGNKTECWPWMGIRDKKGYGRVRINYPKGHTTAQRLAYCLASNVELADIKDKLILHSCNSPSCCNPDHLRPGTYQDNADDTTKANHWTKGEKVPQSKLNSEEVLYIKDELRFNKKRGSYTRLAAQFNVSVQSIRRIDLGQRWNWLERGIYANYC